MGMNMLPLVSIYWWEGKWAYEIKTLQFSNTSSNCNKVQVVVPEITCITAETYLLNQHCIVENFFFLYFWMQIYNIIVQGDCVELG
jgi:hypothetical protein